MRSLRVLLATLVVGHLGVAVAGSQQPATVNLEGALDLFHRNSPELMLARSRLGSALGSARQDRALPNPVLAWSNEDLGDYSERSLSVTQRVDFLWGTGARGDRSEAQGHRARARFAADSAWLVLELKRSYLQAWSAAANSGSTQAMDSLLDGLLEAARARFAEGDLAGYDVRRLEVERSRIRRQRTLAELEQIAAEERLGAMIAESGRVTRFRSAPLPDRPPDLESGFDAPRLAAAQRQEVVQALAAIQVFTAEATMARGGILNGAGVTGGFKNQSDGREGILLGVQVPIPIFDQRSGAVDAARAAGAAAESEAEIIRRTVAREASLAFHRVTAFGRALAVLGSGSLEEGAEILRIARIAYDQGEVGIVELLDAANASLEAQLRGTTTRAEAWEAYFELDRAVGGLPNPAVTGDRP